MNGEFPWNKLTIVEENDEGIWVSPVNEDGSVSPERMLIGETHERPFDMIRANATIESAKQYFEIALLCKASKYILQSVVFGAFACELALKALLIGEGGKPRGHFLVSLYKSLSPKTIEMILEKVRESMTETDFDEHLKEHNNAFVDMRYIHEMTGAKIFNDSFLPYFANILITTFDTMFTLP